MGHAWTHDPYPGPNGDEHPIVAALAIIAMVAAVLLIMWARFEVHGTDDIEAALSEPAAKPHAKPEPRSDETRDLDAAVTSSRFATGFSP
jgi:hypothetical protein